MALPISENILDKKDSLEKEKHISVDPISLKESMSIGEISFNMMLPPIDVPQPDYAIPYPFLQPPSLLPTKHKFLTSTVPACPTSSSPRFRSILTRKNLKIASLESPRQVENKFVDDVWHPDHSGLISDPNVSNDSFRKSIDFKCNALCMFLPGRSKAKPVRPMKGSIGRENSVISSRVSLEKFERESWTSSRFIPINDGDDYDNGDSAMNLFFDLPLELIKNLGNDADLPVSSAFVFNNKDMKGFFEKGLAQTAATGRKSYDSDRHIRFSTVRNSDESLFSRA